MSAPHSALERRLAADIAAWPAAAAACVLVTQAGPVAVAGDIERPLPWASVTKVVASLAVLEVVHTGRLSLDEPAGPEGSTVRHLLGHASGLAFGEPRTVDAPGRRRTYSNVGIDWVVGLAVERHGSPDAAALLRELVLDPLGMNATVLVGPPSSGAVGPVSDLSRLAYELLRPTVLAAGVVDLAATPSFLGLAGVLPGFGRQTPNDWGLGLEVRGSKSPHWLPPASSPSTVGHFGQSGSFVWADRPRGLAAACATGTPFGPWAAEAWPRDVDGWLALWDESAGSSS